MVATLDDAALLRASFREGNVPKGVAWSPDGTCLLTATEDAQVRLYEVPARARVFFFASVGCASDRQRRASP